MTDVKTQPFAGSDLHQSDTEHPHRLRHAGGLTADVMVDTDLSGIDSRGVSMLMMYERLIQEGRLDLAAKPEVVRDLAAFAVIDGHHGLDHPVAVAGMQLAIQKAQ